jgi:hypothetical protein
MADLLVRYIYGYCIKVDIYLGNTTADVGNYNQRKRFSLT